MSGKAGGKAKPLKKPKKAQDDLDDDGNRTKAWLRSSDEECACIVDIEQWNMSPADKEFLRKKKEEAAALKALKEKVGQLSIVFHLRCPEERCTGLAE